MEAATYKGPSRDLNPTKRGMVIPIGVGSKLSFFDYGPGLGHIRAFVIFIVREVEHVNAVQECSREQDGSDQEPLPMVDKPQVQGFSCEFEGKSSRWSQSNCVGHSDQ